MRTPSTTPPLVGATDSPDTPHGPESEVARAEARPGYANLVTVFVVLLLGAGIACAFGFFSPDSWHYIFLAQSMRQGLGCTEQGTYFAIFPCGYPLAIALVSPFTDVASLLVSSKLINVALLFLTFVLLARSPLRTLTAALVALNPVALRIFQFTWSENLFLFAFAASMSTIVIVHRNGKAGRHGILLALWLMIGCGSRYAFGPFAAVMFACVALAWGRQTALKVLPSFAAAALFFVAYQAFNVMHAGFGTGMSRVPAPESLALLGYAFGRASVRIIVPLCATALVLLVLAGARPRPLPLSRAAIASEAGRCHLFLILAGVGYLIMQFVMRMITQFDIFYPRTIGYGYAFMLAGAAGLFLVVRKERVPVHALALYGLTCTLLAQGPGFALRLAHAPGEPHVSTIGSLEGYRSAPTDARLIVNFITPRLNATTDGANALYYPPDKQVVTPGTAPYARPETFNEFRARLPAHKAGTCVLDFTQFSSSAQFSEYADEMFPVDLRLHGHLAAPELILRNTLDPTLRAWLWARFVPGRYADCGL